MGVSQAIRSQFKEFNRIRPQSQPELQDHEPKAKKAKVSSKMPMSTAKKAKVSSKMPMSTVKKHEVCMHNLDFTHACTLYRIKTKQPVPSLHI